MEMTMAEQKDVANSAKNDNTGRSSNPTTNRAQRAPIIDTIRERLLEQNITTDTSGGLFRLPDFRVQSLRTKYSRYLLERYYNEHMMINFPLDDERDSLDDWIECLDPTTMGMSSNGTDNNKGPIMDILLLLYDNNNNNNNNNNNFDDDEKIKTTKAAEDTTAKATPIILAGVAFEYYQQAQVGLISYLTVDVSFRKLGIMKRLHPLAITALKELHLSSSSYYNNHNNNNDNDRTTTTMIKAIFAETNTIDAADEEGVSTAEIINRHRALYALGYRKLNYPYSQPPLGTENQDAFDNVMLLVYQGQTQTGTETTREGGDEKNNKSRFSSSNENKNTMWFDRQTMPSTIAHEYIVDFFMSVYGYHTNSEIHSNDNNNSSSNDDKLQLEQRHHNCDTLSFTDHPCYKLSKWFCEKNVSTTIQPDLPWVDAKNKYRRDYDETNFVSSGNSSASYHATRHNVAIDEYCHIIGVVGAGAAGLAAAVHIAKNAAEPTLVKLIEANNVVGGRIRSIITTCSTISDKATSAGQSQYLGDDTQWTDRFEAFSPWVVPLGAEFIHGINSVVNDLIEDEGWHAEETFNFCGVDDYPTQNSFTTRRLTSSLSKKQRESSISKIFGDGQFWDLNQQSTYLHCSSSSSSSKNNEEEKEISRYGSLIQIANEIWADVVCSVEDDAILPGCHRATMPINFDISISTFIEQRMEGSTKEDTESVKLIIDAIYANTAGTSVDEFGKNETRREDNNWDYSECNFRTKQCFAEIIHHYLEEIESINNAKRRKGESNGSMIELIKSSPIVNVGYDNTCSKVSLSSREGKLYSFDKVIMAVPLGVLKAGDIAFSNECSLPCNKKLAIEKICFHSGMKALLLLRKNIQEPQDMKGLLHNNDLFFCPEEIFSQVWVRRNEDTIFITGFVVSNRRRQLLQRMEENPNSNCCRDIFLDQLQRMFPREIANCSCDAFDLYDWSDDEFVKGIYSSPSIDAGLGFLHQHHRSSSSSTSETDFAVTTARDDIRAPIRDYVYFAGEHTNTKTCATVQAAIESGLLAASEVLKSLV